MLKEIPSAIPNNKAGCCFNPRSGAPALERTALEAPASCDNLARQEPREQRVPRQEPRNKDINSDLAARSTSYSHSRIGRFCRNEKLTCPEDRIFQLFRFFRI